MEQLESLLAYRPALIIGDAATVALDERISAFDAVLQRAEHLGMNILLELRENAGLFFDAARSWDAHKAAELEREYKDSIATLKPTLEVTHLAAVNWSAVISVCEDTCLEQALQTRVDRAPSSRTLTLVSHPGVHPPARTVPVFRLLGDIYSSSEESRLATSASDLLLRKQEWSDLLTDFGDYAKNAVVIV
ncbi:MAG: hypothetical protein ACREPX_02555, partial [Rhodanobacteraceae bacterium]